jgi:hypothetical protein
MNAFAKLPDPYTALSPEKLELSGLVKRLIRARNDAAKATVLARLLRHSEERLRNSLGFTDADIAALRQHGAQAHACLNAQYRK